MATDRGNPFTPGAGRSPPLLAERERATRILSDGVRDILDGDHGNGVVLCGPRGAGKTALLAVAARHAAEGRANVRELAPAGAAGGTAWRLRAPGRQPGTAAGNVPGEVAPPPGCVVLGLHSVAMSGPTLLLVDDAHRLPPALGRVLLHAIRRCVSQGLPLLAVLAGDPRLPETLGNTGADFWELMPDIHIGRIGSDDAVRMALALPAERSGLPIDGDAADLLVRESEGHPFFIQLLGSEAWREGAARRGAPRRITLADARRGAKAANRERERLCAACRAGLRERGLLDTAEWVSGLMVAPGGRTLHWKTAKAALTQGEGPVPPDARWDRVRQDLRALERLGVVWSVGGGFWEPGIPALCRHLVAHA